ncbi:DUF2235 domain-containing protein [Terrarubrum flagellatum]|uniref:DUF2235 domain-containing protein n=1 Tax=Terrirubrum flagellatum TaxID=2895980 RepID=UPI0031453B7C
MAKNVCIFSDGTGQAGGDNPLHWTNVYRLYKFTREIAPGEQIAFYDAGLGSDPDVKEQRAGFFSDAYKWLSQATGLGITRNIIDCYAALMLAFEPDDRIFLLGFSRGAYTARSLGGALGLCGVPRNARAGRPPVANWREFQMRLDETRALAKEAVTEVYQVEDEAERKIAAAEFRARHHCIDATPYFIGVWDTVRALGLKGFGSVIEALGLKHKFHNASLNPAVPFGRQALSIDENRAIFRPEIWDERGAPSSQSIRQTWFAGVHADVGGGYPDSRGLSDIALSWMIEEAKAIPHPLIVDPAIDPPLTPSAVAGQHDERRTSLIPWAYGDRREFVSRANPGASAKFHAAVKERFDAEVIDILARPKKSQPYRPEALRERPEFAAYYG